MLVTIEGKMATAIKDDAELRAHEEAGEPVHDYELTTGRIHLAYDGSKWLIERPDLGPHETTRR